VELKGFFSPPEHFNFAVLLRKQDEKSFRCGRSKDKNRKLTDHPERKINCKI
jgi:hypothetical protein